MNEREILKVLGLPDPLPPGRHLRPEIAAGLADVPPPGSGEGDDTEAGGGHLRVFAAFLKIAGPPPRVLVRCDEEDGDD